MARKPSGTSDSNGRQGRMRDNIKVVATELFIRHGLHGVSFRDIAQRLDTTTTNIHYHFGNKEKLVDEVVRDYVAYSCARQRDIWLNPETSLAQKLDDVEAYNYARYVSFNPAKRGGLPWSLIGRLRLDSEALSAEAREALSSFTIEVHAVVKVAVENARRKNELVADAPTDDIAFLIVNLVNSSSVFTQDAGSFERLQQFYRAFSHVVLGAYSTKTVPAATEA